ncbi:MAG: undecaprenyl-phosphate glucose phosphotransferase, partial [Bacteroidia bacterium]|nr:undecaprenyl-phosphate glucose phosphotransferase [Bacteroidia bacterium]MBT8393616.1 undecaprenyl-phosphate glucose phosphotransferase [Bacteroidia bacterium]
MLFKHGRYSGFITPISYGIDLLVINLFAYLLPINLEEQLLFHSYISLSWIIISLLTEFYIVYRYSKVTHILRLLFRQFFFYFLVVYAFIGFFKQPNMSRLALAQYVIYIFIAISTLKFLSYYLLMKYRERVKGNIRNVVVIGKNKKTQQLIDVFNARS